MKKTTRREAAQQTFRQFAWNLAGTLARSRPRDGRAAGAGDGGGHGGRR